MSIVAGSSYWNSFLVTQCVSYGDYHVTVRHDVIGLERGRVSMLKICFELVADFKEFNRYEMINLVL